MSRWADVEGLAIDVDGFDCNTPRPFDTVAEAKRWAREVSRDRSYWVWLAESETFPDEIAVIVLRRGLDLISETPVSWKGAAQ